MSDMSEERYALIDSGAVGLLLAHGYKCSDFSGGRNADGLTEEQAEFLKNHPPQVYRDEDQTGSKNIRDRVLLVHKLFPDTCAPPEPTRWGWEFDDGEQPRIPQPGDWYIMGTHGTPKIAECDTKFADNAYPRFIVRKVSDD